MEITENSSAGEVRLALGIQNPSFDGKWNRFLRLSKTFLHVYFITMNFDPELSWLAIPESEREPTLTEFEADLSEKGIRWGNAELRRQVVDWRVRNIHRDFCELYKKEEVATAAPTALDSNLPSSADAGPSNEAVALTFFPALSTEQTGAEELKSDSKDKKEEHNPVPEAAARTQGTEGRTFDPVRDEWH